MMYLTRIQNDHYKLFLSKPILTVSSFYDSWHVRRKELCILRVSGRLSEQPTVGRRTVPFPRLIVLGLLPTLAVSSLNLRIYLEVRRAGRQHVQVTIQDVTLTVFTLSTLIFSEIFLCCFVYQRFIKFSFQNKFSSNLDNYFMHLENINFKIFTIYP